MKKYLSVLVIVFVAVLLTGCDFNSKKSEDKKDDSKALKVVFSYSPSAAEEVKLEVENEDIVSVEHESSNKDEESRRDGGSVGGTYKIKGKKEGETKVTFTKIKFTNNEVLKKVTYNVKVDKDLNITETHTEEK